MNKKKPFIRLKPRLDPAGEGYPAPLRGLLYLGKPKQGMSWAQWAEPLRDYAPQLIQMALDPDLNDRGERDKAVWAPLHALCVLTELAAPEGVEPLLELLDWDDDWTGDQVIAYYAAVGAPALPVLLAFVRDASHTERARTLAVSSLGAMAAKHPDVRDEVVSILTAMLDQPAADTTEEETIAAWLIVELLDLKATEARPAIQRAFDEDRVNATIVAEQDIDRLLNSELDEEFDDAVEDEDLEDETSEDRPLTLTLKCKACGREREYTFERAYYDIGTIEHHEQTHDSPLLVPERVVCRKCGAVDQYELGALSQFAVLSKLMGARSGLPDPLPSLEIVNLTSERWGWVPPHQLLPRYEAEVAAHPDDLDLRMGYANTLRMLGHPERARAEYERLLLADPNDGDVLFALAQMMAEYDDLPQAIDAWEQLERRFDALRLPSEERELRRQEIQDVLAELRGGKRPAYHGKRISIPDSAPTAARSLPEPPPAPRDYAPEPARPAASPYGKVGRNEPCPCGSGKKYKQCHGKK